MSVIGGVLLAKGASFALGQAKKAVQNKLLDVAKEKAGTAIFGPKLAATGELDEGKKDFRGLQRYKAPQPGGLVKLFCGGDVITGDDLNEKLNEQVHKSFNVEGRSDLPEVARDEDGQVPKVERMVVDDAPEEVSEEPEAKGPDPKDAQVQKPVNRPISMDDFRAMVTADKDGKTAKNKGYVRFVKCDGGKGVTLGKVGNKINALMSWRVNVSKEHNRQMRLLFAETMLADFGGIYGVGENGDNSAYGAVLQSQLAKIRSTILNDVNPGDLLKRTDVRKCMDLFDGIFKETSLKSIAESFMSECLRQCQFDTVDVRAFIQEYGKYVKDGPKTYDELMALVTNVPIRDGKALKAALAKIATAFGQMNEVWQQDKAARNFLRAISANPTSTQEVVPKGKDLDRLRGALLRRMAPDTDVHPNNAETVNLFFEKAFSSIVDSLRLEYRLAKESGKPEDEEDRLRKFSARLSLGSVLSELEAFGKEIRESASSQISPMRVVIQHKEQAKAEILQKLTDCKGNDPKLEAELKAVQDDIAWLEKQEAELKQGKINFSDDFLKDMEQKALAKDADAELKRAWSKDGLMAVLAEGAKSLDATFQRDYAVQNYLKKRCANISYQFNGSVKAIMDDVVTKFENAVKKALAANVQDKDDISPQDLITEFADFLMYDVDIRELRVGEGIEFSKNPNTAIKNARHTAPMLFVEGMMRTAINLAINKKVDGGAKFAQQIESLKAQTGTLAHTLADLFVKVKKGKLAGLTGFINDLRSFQYKGVGNADDVQVQRTAFLQGARQLIFVKLMTQFIEKDLPDLLSETDIKKFAAATEDRLDLRVEEAMSSFMASTVQQFYEGTLHFKTNVEDLAELQNAFTGDDVRDEETGYTNPADVARKFQTTLADMKLLAHVGNPDLKRPVYRAFTDKDLVGALTRHAENVWRQNVVSHAPGRHRFVFIDMLISKFQDLLKVSVDNRRVDISSAWLDRRAADFKKEMNAFVTRYASFESRLVKACRDEVAKALTASGDPRFASVRDPAVREQLIDDVLATFNGEISGILKDFIANPKAYANTGIDNPGIFGSDTRLGVLVRDTLGLSLRGEVTDIKTTEGFRRLSEALDNTIRYRADFVNSILEKHGDVFNYVMVSVNQAPDGKGCGALKVSLRSDKDPAVRTAAAKVMEWVTNQGIAFAKANPIEVYEVESSDLVRKLGDRILADLAVISTNFEANVTTLINSLESVYKKAEIGTTNAKLEEYVIRERTRLLDEFAGLYCNLALARARKSEYSQKFEELVTSTVNRFQACIDGAKNLNGKIYAGLFESAIPALESAQREGAAQLLSHGATADLMLVFNKRCEELQKTLPERLEKSIKSLDEGEYAINSAVSKINLEIQDEVAKMAAEYANRLDSASVNFNAEGFEKLLAAQGVKKADYPDTAAFDATVKMLLDDPAVIDLFVKMQKFVINAPAAGGILSSDASYIDYCVKPVFELQYKVHAAQNRVDAQIAAVNERLTAAEIERNAPEGIVGGIHYPLTNRMKEIRRTLDIKPTVEDFMSGKAYLNPDEVNLDVEKLVGEATELLDKQIVEHQLETERNAWMESHYGVIFNRAYKTAPEAFGENRNDGVHAKEKAQQSRKDLDSMLHGYVMSTLMMSNAKEDWDKAFESVLAAPDAPLTKEACDKISPQLFVLIDGAKAEYVKAQAYDVAERAIDATLADLEAGVNKSFIIEHMPSTFGRDNDHARLLKRNAAFADPVKAAEAYPQRFKEIDDKEKAKLLDPSVAVKVAQDLQTARLETLRTFKTQLLDEAKKADWTFTRNEKALNGLAKQLQAAMNAALKGQPNGKTAFEEMLKYMRVPRT